MERIKLVLGVGRDRIADVLEKLADMGETVSVLITSGTGDAVEPEAPAESVRTVRRIVSENTPRSTSTVTTLRRVRDAVVRSTPRLVSSVYSLSPAALRMKLNAAKIGSLAISQAQRDVLAYVVKHGPANGSREIAKATGMNAKYVESIVYQLRHTEPPMLVSKSNGGK